ncbi:MAG: ABC transporter substrate-binding protein [Candidatus Thorarchaeota archaeon]
MKVMERSNLIIAALLIVVIVQSAALVYLWQVPPGVPDEERETLTIGSISEVGRDHHPQVVKGGDNDITHQIYEGLLGYKYGETFEMEPLLATDLGEVSEDGLEYTFSLREGIKFHDGTDFNATAVKHHFDLMFELQQGMTYIFHQELLNRTEVVDEYTVRFYLNYANTAFRYMLCHISAMIPSPTSTEAGLAEGDVDTYKAGTGPYTFTSKVIDNKVILDANEDWWRIDEFEQEVLQIDRLQFLMIGDASTLRSAVETGVVDLTTGSLNEADYPDLRENEDLQTFDVTSASSVRWLTFNMNSTLHDVFPQDKRMRQAFAYAINYDVIIDTVYEGDAERLDSYLPPEYDGYIPAAEDYTYDPDAALSLIDEAGFETPVEITIHSSGSYTPRETEMLEVIEEYALAAGFDVTIDIQEIGVYRQQYRETDNQEITLWRWRADYPAADNYNVPFISSYGYGTGYCKVEDGDMSVLYPEVDDLVMEAAGTTNETRYIEIVEELQEIWAEWLPNIFVYRPKWYQFGDAALEGVWFGGLQWDMQFYKASFA